MSRLFLASLLAVLTACPKQEVQSRTLHYHEFFLETTQPLPESYTIGAYVRGEHCGGEFKGFSPLIAQTRGSAFALVEVTATAVVTEERVTLPRSMGGGWVTWSPWEGVQFCYRLEGRAVTVP